MENHVQLKQSDVQSSDRYGFTSRDRSSGVRVHVSSTGRVTQTLLPPLDPNPELIKALESPWLNQYRHFCKCLTLALKGEAFKEDDNQINIAQAEPFFLDSKPDNRNVTIFGLTTISVSLYITKEDKDKFGDSDSVVIFPFGKRYYQIPQCPVTFYLNLVGKAYGQFVHQNSLTVIRFTRLEDLTGEPLSWASVPVGTCLNAVIDISGILPAVY